MSRCRPDYFSFPNGDKTPLQFSDAEYARRLSGLRAIMAAADVDAVLLTSMHGIAYYSGFLYCSFGRAYACVVTHDECTTVSANIDGGQPWRRSIAANLVYTDWRRGNYWRAVQSLILKGSRLGIEADHLTLQQHQQLGDYLEVAGSYDIAPASMGQQSTESIPGRPRRTAS